MKGQRLLAAVTIFVGSFLVFGVQPMVGNTLLPSFGGTAAVWTVCLAAFQILLLAGYFYADRLRNPRLHLGFLLVGVVWVMATALAFRPVAAWAGEWSLPALGALFAVVALVGVPYVLLSSNASLVQRIVSVSQNDRGVYKLYAISNVGSFCGLLAYPLLVEPFLGIGSQWFLFAGGVAAYALLVGALVLTTDRQVAVPPAAVPATEAEEGKHENVDPDGGWVEWLGLSALSCFVLNGVTAHLCNDLTPLPLLWAVMLAVYLLTWVFGFTDRGARVGPAAAVVTLVLVGVGAWHLPVVGGGGFVVELGVGLGVILFGCWTIHARLFRIRPGSRLLTRYYLMISLGGAIGGTAASLAMPALFSSVVEYPAALALLAVPCAYEFWHVWVTMGVRMGEEKWRGKRLDTRAVLALVAIFGAVLWHFASIGNGQVLLSMRNFYGTGRVLVERMKVDGGEDYDTHMFEHAGTKHGMQPTWTGLRDTPTMYFGPHAGGLAIQSHPKYKASQPVRVAMAGMGIATLATYARKGDDYRYYEINPQVAALAADTNYFWYVSDCKGHLDIVVDDARRALEKERAAGAPKWDVLIIDVFAGDSIPPHMATKEAFALYRERLAPGGVLAMHLTNWHLGLAPMAKAAAHETGLCLQGLGCWADKFNIGSFWTFFTEEKADFYVKGKNGRVDFAKVKDVPLMTDEKHSLLPYISLKPMPDFVD